MASVPRVLVIDQDPEVRYQIQQLVAQAGFEAGGEAGLGTEAIALATDAAPDIVLCALKEPVGRALQTIEAIVHDLPETPLIAYAESSELALIRQAMLAGARDFLQAPFKPQELRRSLSATLESEERRRLRETGDGALGPRGAIITVFGAKGGTGKTTLATNLGVALAGQETHTAVLVDADDTFGDAAASLGLRPARSITEALREPEDGAGVKRFLSHHDSGLAVLSAPASPFEWQAIAGERLQQGLRDLASQFDIVLVDTASTLSEVTLAALQAASLVLWVTTPDYASAHDSLRALQALRGVPVQDDRIRLVLNNTSSEMDVSPKSVEEALSRPIFWSIPHDREVRRSTQLGRAVVEAEPGSEAAASFADLAKVLTGAAPQPRKAGIVRRLFAGRNGKIASVERVQEAQL